MSTETTPFSPDSKTYRMLGDDRVLSITDVAEALGVCPVTASKIIKESGREIVLHRRIFILQSSFLAFLAEREAMSC